MGTSYHQQDPKQYGIVPRFAENLFDWIQTQLNNNDMTYKYHNSRGCDWKYILVGCI